MKVAKLVLASLMTRVIAEDTETEEQIIDKAKNNFLYLINNDLNENIEEVTDDTECPYNPDFDK